MKPQKLFCTLCFDNEKGKTTYQSHKEGYRRCPTKLALNAMMTDYEIEEEQEEEPTPEETEASPDQQQYTWLHCLIPGLDHKAK